MQAKQTQYDTVVHQKILARIVPGTQHQEMASSSEGREVLPAGKRVLNSGTRVRQDSYCFT